MFNVISHKSIETQNPCVAGINWKMKHTKLHDVLQIDVVDCIMVVALMEVAVPSPVGLGLFSERFRKLYFLFLVFNVSIFK